MGTDLGTVRKRLNEIIALLGSHADLPEADKNMPAPVVAPEQTMSWRLRTPNELMSMGCSTVAIEETVLYGANWMARITHRKCRLGLYLPDCLPTLAMCRRRGRQHC